jgi:hypothetical protein
VGNSSFVIYLGVVVRFPYDFGSTSILFFSGSFSILAFEFIFVGGGEDSGFVTKEILSCFGATGLAPKLSLPDLAGGA